MIFGVKKCNRIKKTSLYVVRVKGGTPGFMLHIFSITIFSISQSHWIRSINTLIRVGDAEMSFVYNFTM